MKSYTDVVKGLNLNKNPKGVPNGSLIFAKNIKLDDDANNITNEEGLKSIVNLQEADGNIVGFITTDKEIIIFTDANKIIRYKEESNEIIHTNINWIYNGGKIHGTYNYNINNDLIIAIGEYDANINVPLKVINLDNDISLSNKLQPIAPNVPIANLNLISNIPGNNIPNGIYYFFIRYEIAKDTYTAWFPMGVPQYAINSRNKTIIDHYYDLKDYSSKHRTTTYAKYNDVDKDYSYNFKFRIDIAGENYYSKYQIGFILQHDESTICRIWKTFNISVTEFVFNYTGSIEGNINEMITNPFNCYNVKCLTNYDNRLYIANFTETNYNEDYIDFAKDIVTKSIRKKLIGENKTVSTTSYKYKYKLTYKGKDYTIILPNERTLVKITANDDLCNIFSQMTENAITPEQVKTLYTKRSDNINDKPFNLNDYYLNFEKTSNVCLSNADGSDAYGRSGYSDVLLNAIVFYKAAGHGTEILADIQLYNITIKFESKIEYDTVNTIISNNNRTLMPNQVYSFYIHYVRPDGTYTNGIKIDNQAKVTDNEGNDVLDKNNESLPIDTLLKDVATLNIGKSGSIIVGTKSVESNNEESSSKVNSASTYTYISCNNLKTFDELANIPVYEIMPNCIFYDIANFGYYTNYNNDKLFKARCGAQYSVLKTIDGTIPSQVQYRQGVGFTNIRVPKDFIGFFFTYEQVENTNSYQAIVESFNNSKTKVRASDVETGKVNYNGKIFIPQAVLHSDGTPHVSTTPPFLIENSNIVVSNYQASNENLDELDTVGLNGGIVLSLQKSKTLRDSVPNNTIGNVISLNRNIYTNKNKVLIPFGPIAYVGEHKETDTFSYADNVDFFASSALTNFQDTFPNNKVAGMEFNYPGFYCQDRHLIYNKKTYIGDDGKVYDINSDDTIKSDITDSSEDYAKILSYNKFSTINLNALSIRKEPEILVGVLGKSTDSVHTKIVSKIVKPLNATDLIEYKNTFIETNPKLYTNIDLNYKANENKHYIIRRSNIIKDENYYNSWKYFASDNYKIIDKQYGKINNIFGIENNFYIHTDNTILCINKDNTIKANNTDIQISTRDLFEGEPIEILVGNHGFGGMQTEDSWCLNQIGYFYLDKDSKRIYIFNDNHLTDLTTDIVYLINNISMDNAWFETDFKNNRVLACIQYHTKEIDKDYITISYDMRIKRWLSLHDYYFTKCLNTKNNCYFWADETNDNIKNIIYNVDKTILGDYKLLHNNTNLFPHYNIDNKECAIFDIIFNDNYLDTKSINSINYLINKVYNYNSNDGRMAEPFMQNESFEDKTHYAGDLIRLYTDNADTGNLDISVNTEINQFDEYKKPHYEKGYWEFNYFRNAITKAATETQLLKRLGVENKNQLTLEQQSKFEENLKKYIPSDNRTLIYGRYFVIRFIIDNNDNIPIRFETLSINYNSY